MGQAQLKKIPQPTLDENRSYHSTISKKTSGGGQEVTLKNHPVKSYLKPKPSKNFIAANKEKVKGGLLDYARTIKESPMVMVDKLNSRIAKDK